MSAAIAAVEGSRQCAKALEKSTKRRSNLGEDGSDADAENEAPQQEAEEKAPPQVDPEPAPKKPPVPTPEQAAAAATQRLVAQRNNNHKVLQRLNAEILGHQRNVREFLRQNRQLIPQVPTESKQKIFGLLRDYATEAWTEVSAQQASSDAENVLRRLRETSMLVPFLQPQSLAIPVSVKARILKMAALYDVPLAMRLLEEELFSRARCSLAARPSACHEVDALAEKVKTELSSNIAEEEVLAGETLCNAGSRTPQDFGGATPTAAQDSSGMANDRGRFGNS